MGIYPNYSKSAEDKVFNPSNPGSIYTTHWTETRELPGVKYTREVVATDWKESERDDCFCCSCGEREGSDVYCRNHGWAGTRACEKHNMPASPYFDKADGSENPGSELETVQAYRDRMINGRD